MILRRVARPLLAAVFISGGLNALRQAEGHAQVAEPFLSENVLPVAEALPVETDPVAVVKFDGAVKVAAGTMLALGRFRRLSSLALLTSITATTVAGHPFWEKTDEGERAQEQVQFLKNAGLAGGLILAMADTEGKPSVGWRAKRAARKARKQVADTTDSLQHTTVKAKGKAESKLDKAGKAVTAR
ncbi:putative membrane protein YphA, DoxX/SURF4 family [Prauserella aidingensis]|uniref:DoxX family protein n=1 Tax=Prauserella aidingensis TaxID=387890 RepID=UPI0020A4D450|nr:DoxX family protein [Prauserella aidingensis]MCP2255080.1 putative membrane protein YphA, DoxX/SURF4 family [Prauserella aidingensis]